MLKQNLISAFKKSTKGNKYSSGERILKNDLISDLNISGEEDKVIILSSVISEDLYNQYSCKIDIDKKTKEVTFTSCTCKDYEKKGDNTSYCCKHLIASFYRFLNEIEEDEELKSSLGFLDIKEEVLSKNQGSILDLLLMGTQKDNIKLELVLTRVKWNGSLGCEFKIGTEGMKSSKLYTLKDMDSFLVALYNNISIPYGKDFTFSPKNQKLTPKVNSIIKFIEMLKEIDLSSNSFRKINEKLVQGRGIIIPKAMVREFLNLAKDFRVYLGTGFYGRVIETEVLQEDIPFPLALKDLGNLIKLEATNGLPEALSPLNNAFLYNATIYLPSYEQIELLSNYLEGFNYGNGIFFTKEEEDRILRELIPSINKISNDVSIANSLKEKVVIAPVNFKFYFDKRKDVTLELKVCYGEIEFNIFNDYKEKVIYRDVEKENKLLYTLRGFGFEQVEDKFILFRSDDYMFKFFREDIMELHSYGDIYYSDRFTGIKNISSNAFKGEVKHGKYDYLEFKFKIGDIPSDEITLIINAFRNNKKFIKLNSGEFLDLEEIELKKLLKLIDSINPNDEIEDNTLKVEKNKGIFIEDYLQDNEMTYIKGRKDLKSLKKSLMNIKEKDYEIPSEINCTLRGYQVKGYAWLKTIDKLGFGGILGDEMGLGKTVQTITFLTSNKGKKSLIVAPTSLVYNWLNEFKKFSPNMKIGIIHGRLEEREKFILDYEKYDVLITTYNLIRRDINLYNNINFNYIIIDEAQNIKNHHSQNAKAIKKIKGNTKFALTGTPIENSLMELWSIFDFIMPGYLYDEKKFQYRYHRRLEEDKCLIDDLNKLIKPFILRRYKRDVIKELPDKIESKLIVPLEGEQLKVYSSYVNYVQDILDKKVKNDELKNSKIEILSYLTKLRQICLDPSVVMDDYTGGSSKLEALIERVKASIDEGHKILVFSQFTQVLTNISNLFKENHITYYYLDGSTDIKKRNEMVEDFNKDNTEVFLISLKAGGTGLNLTSADIVIHFDPWWNPAVEEQATDRAHRIGQNNVVEVIKMVSEGTIEEKIISLQQEKKDLIEKVLGSEGTNGEILKLSDEELLSLFSR